MISSPYMSGLSIAEVYCMCVYFDRKYLGITESCPDFCITRWNSYTQVAVRYIMHHAQFTRALSALVGKQGTKGDDALRRLVIYCANDDYTMQPCVLASWRCMWLTTTGTVTHSGCLSCIAHKLISLQTTA